MANSIQGRLEPISNGTDDAFCSLVSAEPASSLPAPGPGTVSTFAIKNALPWPAERPRFMRPRRYARPVLPAKLPDEDCPRSVSGLPVGGQLVFTHKSNDKKGNDYMAPRLILR